MSFTNINDANLKRRLSKEFRFKLYCILAMTFALGFVTFLFTSIFSSGYSAFYRTVIQVEVSLSEVVQNNNSFALMSNVEIQKLDTFLISKKSIYNIYPEVTKQKQKKALLNLFSFEYDEEVKQFIVDNKNNIEDINIIYLTVSDDIDQLNKGNFPRNIPEDRRRVSNLQLDYYDNLVEQGKVSYVFNLPFFTRGDSREPELAGAGGAIVGSFFTIMVVLILSLPIGMLAAIYLQEFAPQNRFTDFIEININNLAAVPSIVFGLLGLGILLNTFGMPRSTALVGGVTLALMTLPTIIIATRASLRAVPPSIREAALAVGATRMQTVMHHVVPVAMPGSLTGAIIGLAQALGETAPLLLIGMVAFIVDVPGSPVDSSSSLPVQIYLWAESAERGFVEKTSATIMILLAFLILLNLAAVIIRRKFETKW